jgi:D-xylose reductase
MLATHARLSSGSSIPLAGFGMWKVPKNITAETVVGAIEVGYRLFDNACDYGNEKEVGDGLKTALSRGLVKREDLWITSKLWNTFHAKEHVKAACQRTLNDLGLEYLDLYLIHFPISLKYVAPETRYPPEWIYDPTSPTPRMEFEPVPISETWRAMEELVDAGLVRNIGVANFNCSLLRDLLSYARIKPAVNQVEIHPYLTQQKLIRYCHENGIHVTAYSSFGGTSYVELGGASKSDCVFEEQLLQEIGGKHGKSAAQVALTWAVQRGISVIPKTNNPKRLVENFDIFGFTLTSEEMEQINSLNKNKRFNDPGVYCELAFRTYCPIYE